MRAPVGGLFRHVRDLTEQQANTGHEVGILCDATTGGTHADALFDEIAPYCALGVTRIPMSRQLGPSDVSAYRAVHQTAKTLRADILHGHGAKGGAFARLAGRQMKKEGLPVKSFYTPHGGSLHYKATSPVGFVFLTLERLMSAFTDGMIFESAYSSAIFDKKVGVPTCERRIIPNGLCTEEFDQIAHAPDAADFLFIGELRELKGVQILIDAAASIAKTTQSRTIIVGSGPDEQHFKQHVSDLGMEDFISFPGRMPARDAFILGRCLIVPSFAESFPYIVLEAAAAQMPLITTNVGGIPEIYADTNLSMIPPKNVEALTDRMREFLETPADFASDASILRANVQKRFTVEKMSEDVLAFYDTVRARNSVQVHQPETAPTNFVNPSANSSSPLRSS